MRIRAFWLAAAFLAGCASLPEPAPPGDPEALFAARRAELVALTVWELRGRVALRAPGEGWQAGLRWLHRDGAQALDLTGPFGGGYLRLTEDDGGARLTDSSRRVYEAADATMLLARTTGWQVPLDGLDHWVRGLPLPDVPARRELDAHGRLKRLVQRGWNIEYLAYAEFAGHELPSRLYISRELPAEPAAGPEDPRLEVRLAIQSWRLAARDS
ncbi:membrane protein [Sulfurifustis variabilis]|uniref:Outer-membrane lipoprotein LolB n=1 Tax=Sulfurifustis variabilis TaxID=1675686 RepID=A0A1B4V763_9GAMM|nr:lipoprotein insertase outer membrane protein LolB [Sulfurifustis variabilis]BAU47154.1 membrane protein [Sulfurifustis variabilis]